MTPRIYVACLAAYNNGKLHGKWIDANQEAKEIYTEISEMLKSSPEPGAEDWAVHDHEGFGEITISEWGDIQRIAKIARIIEDEGDAFSIWYKNQYGNQFKTEELEERFLKQWQGCHDSEADFADYLLDSTGALNELPGWAKGYFNYAAYAQDLRLSGDYSFVRSGGQIYAFSSY